MLPVLTYFRNHIDTFFNKSIYTGKTRLVKGLYLIKLTILLTEGNSYTKLRDTTYIFT